MKFLPRKALLVVLSLGMPLAHASDTDSSSSHGNVVVAVSVLVAIKHIYNLFCRPQDEKSAERYYTANNNRTNYARSCALVNESGLNEFERAYGANNNRINYTRNNELEQKYCQQIVAYYDARLTKSKNDELATMRRFEREKMPWYCIKERFLAWCSWR